VRKYRNERAPAKLSLGVLVGSPLGSVLAGGPAEHPAGLVLSLLLADDAANRLMDGVGAGRIETGARFEGVVEPLTAIALERGIRPGLRLGIEPGTGRLRAIDLLVDPAKLAEKAPPGTRVAEWSMSWRSGPIASEPPDASAFSITPPQGFTAVATAQARQAAEAEKHPLVGNPAPDFRLDVVGEKATKPVARADLAGQVVVLDFWATWCGPCRMELPELQALTQRLAKTHAGKVRVIAVSQDRVPDDGSPVRKLVETTLAELKVDLATGPVAQVALDPDQLTGDAFKVTGLPTLVVLDAQGVVQSVHVGYREGVGDELFQEIETLLSGKSLLDDKPANGPKDG
jgi:thiol-disulfide isomerase/thioredoxin